jgi:hypothetical protein
MLQRSSIRLIAGHLPLIVTLMLGNEAFAVRPFVTDDARVVYPGQLEVENFAGVDLARG